MESEDYVVKEIVETKRWVYTDEGKLYVENGTPEFRIAIKVPPEGIHRDQLSSQFSPEEFKIGFANAMSKKYLTQDK